MIEVLKINGQSIFINSELIRVVESTPDTLITFTDGQSLVVKNQPQEIKDKIIMFKKKLLAKD